MPFFIILNVNLSKCVKFILSNNTFLRDTYFMRNKRRFIKKIIDIAFIILVVK